MKRAPRHFCVVLILLLLPALANAGTEPHGEILWDTFGVPHVFARNEAGLFYGFGWAQAPNHGNVILHLYGEGSVASSKSDRQ